MNATLASPPASGSRPPVTAGGPYVISVLSSADDGTTVHSHVATGESTAALSPWYTRTSKMCSPSGRPLYAFGGRHGENVPPSSEDSYRRPSWFRPSATNSKRALRVSVV